MRKFTLLIAAACAAIAFAPVMQAQQKFINATYSVSSWFKSQNEIVAEELKDFDFIYFSAAPKWEVADFDLPQSEINKKYVEQHTYPDPEFINKFVATVHETGGKVLCSFPGQEFIDIASSPERSKKFAQMMAQFVKKYNYDGIELDWEHTITEELHISFMQDIRKALTDLGNGKRQYWLTTALHHYRNYTPEQAKQLCDCADWINIMFYDMGGGIWGKTATHNTPLDQIKKSISTEWKHFPHEKLHIGLASYGFYYKGIKPGETIPEGKKLSDYGRYCNYTELPPLLADGWQEQWDDVAQCAYFVSPDRNEFMTLETKRSIDAKLDWIEESGFGGVFWWEYSCDWIRPQKSGERGTHLIIDHVTNRIKNNK